MDGSFEEMELVGIELCAGASRPAAAQRLPTSRPVAALTTPVCPTKTYFPWTVTRQSPLRYP